MPLKPATFKKAVIAHTGGLPTQKGDKVKGWIEHNGAKYSKEITDDVTHLIISSTAWKNYKQEPMVVQARRKRTIYLMRLGWLEDSLTCNNRKPLNEVDEKYTWEIEHAEKVLKKRKEKQLAARKERLHAQRAEAREAYDADMYDRARVSSDDKSKTGKMRQVIDCGIKFDKSLLEFERDLALGGYQPYVDGSGFVHVITLVRNDIWKKIQEHYLLKSHHPQDFSQLQDHQHSSGATRYGSSSSDTNSDDTGSGDTTLGAWRRSRYSDYIFTTNEDTDVHYLEDNNCCRTRRTVRSFSEVPYDGLRTPRSIGNGVNTISDITQRLNTLKLEAGSPRSFSQWPQHIPFSVYPVTSYLPGPGPPNIFQHETRPAPHVLIPQPIAYSLQLYESFDRPTPLTGDSKPTPEDTPQPVYRSCASYLSRPTSPVITAVSVPSSQAGSSHFPTSEQSRPRVSREKRYAVHLHYTKKATNPRMKIQETTELAPNGSTWEFAYDMFRKFFWKKTGTRWEDAKNGQISNPADSEERRDSGIGLNSSNCVVGPGLQDGMNIRNDAAYDTTRTSGAATDPEYGIPNLATRIRSTDMIAASRQAFTYIQTNADDLAHFGKRYSNQYGEDWLPAPCVVKASSQGGKLESEEGLLNDDSEESGDVENTEGIKHKVLEQGEEMVEENGKNGLEVQFEGVNA